MDPIALSLGPEAGAGPPATPASRSSPAAVTPVKLTGPQKAAVIVQALAREGAPLSLTQLPEDIQAALIQQMGQIGPVDQGTIDAVMEEFQTRLQRAGLSGNHGIKRALDMLGGAVSPTVAQRLRDQTTSVELGDPWERIGGKEAETLQPLIDAQSIEVAAVILSKLKVSKAAEILGLMPGDKARRITYAISMTAGVTPDAVRRIGQALARLLSIQPARVFEEGPVERLGAILNCSRAATRNEVLEGLDETDADFAEEVRRAIFTFANIPERITPRDTPKFVRQVEQDVLVRALSSALSSDLAPVAEFILSGLSQRMGDALRGEIEDAGDIDEESGEAAMDSVVAAIRELESSGEIQLTSAEA